MADMELHLFVGIVFDGSDEASTSVIGLLGWLGVED